MDEYCTRRKYLLTRSIVCERSKVESSAEILFPKIFDNSMDFRQETNLRPAKSRERCIREGRSSAYSIVCEGSKVESFTDILFPIFVALTIIRVKVQIYMRDERGSFPASRELSKNQFQRLIERLIVKKEKMLRDTVCNRV